MSLPSTIPYVGWAWDDLVFLALAGVLLGGALMVVLSRNIIRSGLFMVLSFLGLAGIYALMGATLVAAAQVLVYIGAISVLILFAVMLTQSKSGPTALVFHHQAWAAAIASLVLGALFVMSILFTTWPLAVPAPIEQSAKDVATLIFKDNVFAFEVVSLLLLAAVVGGVYLARRESSADDILDAPSPAGATGVTGPLSASAGLSEEP
ncbi:MAG: NADH-quinone oxidoreductase subunit J [Chloroflexota bacterium]